MSFSNDSPPLPPLSLSFLVFSYDKHACLGGVHRDVAEQEPDPDRGGARHQPGDI